jgi:antitoxin (DNA-binding transcriptional repressor) of toxin-antitoxin stability system
METVGIRELKSKLSAYLRLVKAGEVVRVTDRGEVVAEIHAPDLSIEPTRYPELNRLIHSGELREAAAARPEDLYQVEDGPRFAEGEAQAVLEATRGER